MKNITILILILLTFSCKKNTQAPTAPAQQSSQNSIASTSTFSAVEGSLVAKWYYEKYQVISNNQVSSTCSYSGDPSFNTIEFKNCASVVSTNTMYPNFKEYVKIQNGSEVPGPSSWKVNTGGVLFLSTSQINTILIDSLTSTRFVYTDGSGYPNVVSGTRYYLHK